MLQTTSLFFEQLFIGAGAAIWVLLLTLAVLGPGVVPLNVLLTPQIVVISIPIVYLLGILTEGFADTVFFHAAGNKLTEMLYPKYEDRRKYYDQLRFVMAYSEVTREALRYTRLNFRLCRGWEFNGFLSLLAWLLLWHSHDNYVPNEVGFFGLFGFMTLSMACRWRARGLLFRELAIVKCQSPYWALPEEEHRKRARSYNENLSSEGEGEFQEKIDSDS